MEENKMERIFEKHRYEEEKVGHLHTDTEGIEEYAEHGEIIHRKVKQGRLTIPKFG